MFPRRVGYAAPLVACGWAGAGLEKVIGVSEREPYAQKAENAEKVKREPTD